MARWTDSWRRGVVLLVLACASWGRAWAVDPVEFLITDPFRFLPDTGTAQPGAYCSYKYLPLPGSFRVLAAGADSGQPQTQQIDGTGEEASRVDVAVNSPDAPVVLMLFGRTPTIWNIGWSLGTHIMAVYTSGYGRQLVSGIHTNIPMLISTAENRGPCGYIVPEANRLDAINLLSQQLFGRPVERFAYPVLQGRVLLGDPPLPGTTFRTRSDNPPEQWRTPQDEALLRGLPGLDNAIRLGLLRRATPADTRAWLQASARSPGLDRFLGSQAQRHRIALTPQTYVVTGQGGRITLPQGLVGTQAAIFIVPQGVPRPLGDPGHSTVYDFNTMTCTGPSCVF